MADHVRIKKGNTTLIEISKRDAKRKPKTSGMDWIGSLTHSRSIEFFFFFFSYEFSPTQTKIQTKKSCFNNNRPQLYVNGEFIGGTDIVIEMHESGELKELLEEVKAADKE